MTDNPKEWWTQVDAVKDEKLDGNAYDAGYHDGIKEGITRGVNMMVDKCKPIMRALWLARAERAKLLVQIDMEGHFDYITSQESQGKKPKAELDVWYNGWVNAERKCRQYANKFKEEK